MTYIFAQKTNRAFFQTVFTATAALMAIVLVSFKAYQISGLYLSALMHKIKDACGCESMAQFFAMHPDIFRAVILFGIGVAVFILYSLYKLAGLILRTKKFTEYYLSLAELRQSAKLKGAARSLGLDKTKIIEIDSRELAVFCFGFLDPKILISSALVDLLDKNELKAVLAHESQHMNSYEPLKLFIVKYLRSIFFFLPGLKTSARKYMTFSELSADEQASSNIIGRSKLASAILKISEQEEHYFADNGPSMSFFSLTIHERANRLADGSYIPKFRFLDKSLIAGSLGLAVVSFLFIFIFSTSTNAFEMHNISGCVLPQGQNDELICGASYEQNDQEQDISDVFNAGIVNGDSLKQDSVCKTHQ